MMILPSLEASLAARGHQNYMIHSLTGGHLPLLERHLKSSASLSGYSVQISGPPNTRRGSKGTFLKHFFDQRALLELSWNSDCPTQQEPQLLDPEASCSRLVSRSLYRAPDYSHIPYSTEAQHRDWGTLVTSVIMVWPTEG